jgi:hypothetical protein
MTVTVARSSALIYETQIRELTFNRRLGSHVDSFLTPVQRDTTTHLHKACVP